MEHFHGLGKGIVTPGIATRAYGFTGWKKAGLPTVEHHADL